MWNYSTVIVAYFNNQFDFSASICRILAKTWPSDNRPPFLLKQANDLVTLKTRQPPLSRA